MSHLEMRSVILYTLGVLLCLTTSFCGAAVEYTHPDGLKALYYAKASYCDADSIESWTCGMTCKQHNNFLVTTVITNDEWNLQCYVGIDDVNKHVVVAFRGAGDAGNMLGSSAALPVVYDNAADCGDECRVHFQIQRYYRDLQYYVRRYVVGALQWHSDYSVLVTGHSLGGALAQLASTDLQTQINRYGFSGGAPIVHLYTFGALRVGNEDYARWASTLLGRGAHFHVTHGGDPVPRTPPNFLLGFCHVPQEIYYPSSGVSFRPCVDSYSSEDSSCIGGSSLFNSTDHLYYLDLETGCSM